MAERRRGRKGGKGPGREQNTQKDKREKKFVPWLGEERPTRAPILDLEKYRDHKINVAFTGGRQIEGVLTSFDALMNLVLGDADEILQGKRRHLGTVVARGPLLEVVSPVDGSEFVDNPF